MTDSFGTLATFDENALAQLHELQVEGEPSFVGSLITDYLVQVVELGAKIQAFQQSGDKTGIEKSAHKLKSSSAVLGLVKLAAICLSIEESARASKDTSSASQSLATEIPQAIASLRKYLATLPA